MWKFGERLFGHDRLRTLDNLSILTERVNEIQCRGYNDSIWTHTAILSLVLSDLEAHYGRDDLFYFNDINAPAQIMANVNIKSLPVTSSHLVRYLFSNTGVVDTGFTNLGRWITLTFMEDGFDSVSFYYFLTFNSADCVENVVDRGSVDISAVGFHNVIVNKIIDFLS